MTEDMRGMLSGVMYEVVTIGTDNEVEEVADAIIAALPDMVVPLVWEPQSFLIGWPAIEHEGFIAETVVGGSYKAVNGKWWHSEKGGGSSSNLDQAKAAAQAHYVTQIMAAFGGEAK